MHALLVDNAISDVLQQSRILTGDEAGERARKRQHWSSIAATVELDWRSSLKAARSGNAAAQPAAVEHLPQFMQPRLQPLPPAQAAPAAPLAGNTRRQPQQSLIRSLQNLPARPS